MIKGSDLFDRDAISPHEKLIVKTANKTASDLFKKRYSPHLRDHWCVDVKDLTLEQVEYEVIQGILKLEEGGRTLAKKITGRLADSEEKKGQSEVVQERRIWQP